MTVIDRDVRERHHFHACRNCGNIWDHDPPGDVSRAVFNAMHQCQLCGNEKNCDIAAQNHAEAAEFATRGYISIDGKLHYACPYEAFLAKLGRMTDA